jgi:hypothetical protein
MAWTAYCLNVNRDHGEREYVLVFCFCFLLFLTCVGSAFFWLLLDVRRSLLLLCVHVIDN